LRQPAVVHYDAAVASEQRRSRIIQTVNGPGELAGWAEPLTAALKRADPGVFVGVAIVPCVYSAGTEVEVASAFPTVDAVSSAAATMAWTLRGVVPPGFEGQGSSCVLHLGGDPFLALALGKRAGAVTAAYLERRLSGARWFGRLFARDEGGTEAWGEVQRLRASDGSNEDWFGFSVAISGPYLLCGATGEDGAGSERGAAYLFKKI
jgi:hypothetical protein